MACASIPSPTMFPPRDFLAITDPTAATDNLTVLDDVFASSFLRPRAAPRSTQPATSPRNLLANPSPRLPSALPPSASPRLVELLSPDRAQSVLPFYDVGDFNPQSPRAAAREAECEKERRRRLAWANDLPPRPAHPASAIPSSAVGVVDEVAADRIFSSVPRLSRSQLARSSPPISLSAPEPRPNDNDSDHLMPDLPAMHLNLAPIRSPNALPGPSPFAGPRDLSPSAWGVPTPLPDHRAATAPTPSPSLLARDAIGSWVCQTRTAKQPDVADFSLPVKHASEPARSFATSPGLPTTFNPAAFLNTNSNPSPSPNSLQDPASASAPPKKPRRPDMNDQPYAKMEDTLTPINMFATPTPTSMDEIRSPQVPPPAPVQLQLPHMRPVQPHPHPHPQSQSQSQPQPQPQPQSLASRGIPTRGRRTARHRTPRADQSPDNSSTDPLQCGRCRQRFARRSNLFKHQRSVHVKLRPFPCPLCPMKFKRRDHLNKHNRSVHAGIRQYTCEICGVGFAEKFNRDKHRNGIHHTKRAIRCPCGAYFRDRDNMLNCLRCKRLSGVQRAAL